MKNILLLFIFLPVFSFSQINASEVDNVKVGEISMFGSWLMELESSSNDDWYAFRFRNISYQHIVDVESFLIQKKDLDSFYSLLKTNLEGLSRSESKEIEVELATDDKLTLKFQKGRVSFWLYNGVSWSYSQYFKLKHINKLFGKDS